MESKAIFAHRIGEKKADALVRLIDGEVSEDSTASILQKHPDVTVIAVEEALVKVKSESIIHTKEKCHCNTVVLFYGINPCYTHLSYKLYPSHLPIPQTSGSQ